MTYQVLAYVSHLRLQLQKLLLQMLLLALGQLAQLHLLGQFLLLDLASLFFLFSLRFHLLDFHGVRFATAHKQIMIADAQVKNLKEITKN